MPDELHACRLVYMSAQADGGLTLFNKFTHGPRPDMLTVAGSVAYGIFGGLCETSMIRL